MKRFQLISAWQFICVFSSHLVVAAIIIFIKYSLNTKIKLGWQEVSGKYEPDLWTLTLRETNFGRNYQPLERLFSKLFENHDP